MDIVRILEPTGHRWSRYLFARALPYCCLADVVSIIFATPGQRLGPRRPDPTFRCMARSPTEYRELRVASKARDLAAAGRLLRV